MTAMIAVCAPCEQSEGTRSQLQRWLKMVGEPVTRDEPLIEVETDKVVVEIPAPASGVLQRVLKQAREDIVPGEVLAFIQTEQMQTAQLASGALDESAAKPAGSSRAAAWSAHLGMPNSARHSPAVRRLLKEHSIDSEELRGSGVGGRVTVADVLAYVANRSASPETAVANAQAQPASRRVPHSTTRLRTADLMVESLLRTAPHVTTVFEVDLTAVLAHREKHRAQFERRGAALTLTAYFLAASAAALTEVPEINSRWLPDALLMHDTVDIGVATAVAGRGLLVPVIRNVRTLDLFAIASELSRLVRCAREGRLLPADVSGGTFTISNHGVSGSLLAAPIVIKQPQSAILGVGKLEKRAVVISELGEDRIVVRPRCYVTLTLDHRVVDGARANHFLGLLVRRLERWGLADETST